MEGYTHNSRQPTQVVDNNIDSNSNSNREPTDVAQTQSGMFTF